MKWRVIGMAGGLIAGWTLLSASVSETGPWAVVLSAAVAVVAVAGLFTAGWYGSRLATVDD